MRIQVTLKMDNQVFEESIEFLDDSSSILSLYRTFDTIGILMAQVLLAATPKLQWMKSACLVRAWSSMSRSWPNTKSGVVVPEYKLDILRAPIGQVMRRLKGHILPPLSPGANMKWNQKGFALLIEMLVVMAASVTLLAIALPNMVQIQLNHEQKAAKDRVQMIYQLESASNVCHVNTPNGCVVLDTMLPPNGSQIPAGRYTYVFRQDESGWSYIAAPNAPQLKSVSIDNTGDLIIQ